MPVPQEGLDHGRVAGHRLGDAEDRQLEAAALAEEPEDAPDAGTGAVLVEALHAHVPRREGGRVADLGQEGLGVRVAVQHGVSAPSS